MKLRQVDDEYNICPCCKMRTLVLAVSKEQIEKGGLIGAFYKGEGVMMYGYHYECKNCNAKFIDEDLIKKNQNKMAKSKTLK